MSRSRCLESLPRKWLSHPGTLSSYERGHQGERASAGWRGRIWYTRVSTVSQTLDQQNAAFQAAGVTKTFSDVMSGTGDDRPGLAALMD